MAKKNDSLGDPPYLLQFILAVVLSVSSCDPGGYHND